MTRDNLIFFCNCQFKMFGFIIQIYKNKKLIQKFEDFPLELEQSRIMDGDVIEMFLNGGQEMDFWVSPHLLMYGYISNPKTGYSVMIGPVKAVDISEQTVNDIVKQHVSVSSKIIRDIYKYLQLIPLLQAGRFLSILSCFNVVINETIKEPDAFYEYKPNYEVDPEVYKQVIDHTEKVSFEEIQKTNYGDFEKKIEYFIKNGMTDQIKSLWNEVFSRVRNPVSSDIIRLTKDNCIMSIGIVSKIAMDAGYEPEEVYKLREIYIQQAEICRSVQEVLKLRYNIVIDFTERIREMLFRSSDNPMINRAMKYIADNVEKKISLEDLAKHVNTNRTYLCAKFNESVGMGVSEYINLQKITKAKQLLRFTDKTLVEISNFFSFSSQSYFQKIFKNITGTTPLEYRTNSKD